MPKFIPLLRRNVLRSGRVRDAGLRYSPQRDGCMKSHFQALQPVPAPRTIPAPQGGGGCLGRRRHGLAMLHSPQPRRGFRPTCAAFDTRDL